MNRTKHTLLALALAIPAVLSSAISCTGDVPGPDPTPAAEAPVEQEFSLETRADGAGNPVHGDAYTMMTYLQSHDVTAARKNIIEGATLTYGKAYGFYAFDNGVQSGRPAGTLVPVDMIWRHEGANNTNKNTPAAGINPLQRLPTEAAALSSGTFRAALIHPAIPVRQTGIAELGYLAVYHLDDNVWVSDPDDADGNPATVDPFDVVVDSNRKVHPLPAKLELYPLKAAVSFNFYSEYYDPDDTAFADPKSKDFTISSLRLDNVGHNGWYNPRLDVTFPNYNYVNTGSIHWYYTYRPEYTFNDPNVPAQTWTVMTPSAGTVAGPGPAGNPIQWKASTPVFPSDYRGTEGGSPYSQIKPLVLNVEIRIEEGEDTVVKTASVPVSLIIEKGKRLNFFVNVRSEMIDISYSVTEDWEEGDDSSGDIGGPMIPYTSTALSLGPGGWDPGHSSNDDIGN